MMNPRLRCFARMGASCWLVLCGLLFASMPAFAQPSITQSFVPNNIGSNNTSRLRFVVSNADATPATNLSFTHTLPVGVTLASPANPSYSPGCSNSCRTPSGISVTAPDGGSTINFVGGAVDGLGGECVVEVNVTSSTPATHTSQAVTVSSSAGSASSATVDLTVASNKPGFSMSFSPSSVAVGGQSTLTYTIDNSVNAAAVGNLSFSQTLPEGLAFVQPSDVTTTCGGASLTAAQKVLAVETNKLSVAVNGSTFSSGLEALAANATCTVTLSVTGTAVGSHAVKSGSLLADYNSVGFALDELAATQSPLSLQASFDAAALPGGSVPLVLTLNNRIRDASLANVAFSMDLNTALSGLVATGLPQADVCGAGSQLSGAGVLTFSGGSLASGGNCQFTVMVDVPAGTTVGAYPIASSTITADNVGNAVSGDAATTTLNVQLVPSVTQVFSSSSVAAGDSVTVTYQITNSSTTDALSDISFVSELTKFIDPLENVSPPAAGFCGAGSNAFYDPTFGRLSVQGASLPAGGNCSFDVTFTVPLGVPSGTYTKTITQFAGVLGGNKVVLNDVQADLTVSSGASLSLALVNNPVQAGASTSLRVTMSQPQESSVALTGMAFTLDLDAALSGLVATGLPLNDVCGAGSVMSGSGQLNFSGGSLGVGASCTFDVPLQVPTGVNHGKYTLTSSVLNMTSSSGALQSSAAQALLEVAQVTFTKEFVGSPAFPGDTVTLRYTVENNSTTDATGMSFLDNFGAALSGLAAQTPLPTDPCGAGSSVSGATSLVFSGGSLQAGTSCTFDVTLQVPAGAADGTYTSASGALNMTMGGAIVVDPASARLVVDTQRLQIAKQFVDDPVMPGGQVMLEYTITNLDNAQAVTGLAFSDDLGSALTGLSAGNTPLSDVCGSGSQLSGSNTLALTAGTLAAGASCTFSVPVTVPANAALGTYDSATSVVTGTSNGRNVSGAGASDALMVIAAPKWRITFEPALIGQGQTTRVTYEVDTKSAGQAALDLAMTNALPSGMVVADVPAVTNECGGTLVANAGTTNVSLSNGQLSANATCSFSVALQASEAGTLVNTTGDLTSSLGNSGTVSASLAVNATPVWQSVPSVVDEVDAGVVFDLTDVQVADAEGDLVTVSMAVSNGVLTNVVDADPATQGVQLSGSLTDVNTALAAMQLQATQAGPVSLQLSVSDAYTSSQATYSLLAYANLVFADVSVSESDASLTFVGALSAPVPGGFAMDYVTQDVTATSGEDYQQVSGLLTSDGAIASPLEVVVSVLSDDLFEANEMLTLSTSAVRCETMSPCPVRIQMGQGTIEDDDGPSAGVAVFVSNGVTVSAEGDESTYVIDVVNRSDQPAFLIPVQAAVPTGITQMTWSCSVNQGGVCSMESGTGAVDMKVTLPPNGQASITVQTTVGAFDGVLRFAVAIDPPVSVNDPISSDNQAEDIDVQTIIFGGFDGGFESPQP